MNFVMKEPYGVVVCIVLNHPAVDVPEVASPAAGSLSSSSRRIPLSTLAEVAFQNRRES
jgi:hypothetical protein